MYMSGDMLRSLSESYQEVIELTEENKKCSKEKGKKCGCKKCKKQKAAATVRYLMPLRGLGYGYGRPGRDDDDNKENETEGGVETGGGDASGGDGGGMSEMHELEIANIIVEKAADVLNSFSVDEAIDVISTYLEMNGLQMRYSDLAAMLVELDDWGSHPDAANNPEMQRRAREQQRKRADRERVQNLKSPAAKQREQQRQRERDQGANQRRREAERNAQKREQEKKRAAQSSTSSSNGMSGQQGERPGTTRGTSPTADYKRNKRDAYMNTPAKNPVDYANKVYNAADDQMKKRQKQWRDNHSARKVGTRIGDSISNAPGNVAKATGNAIKATGKAAVTRGMKRHNRDNARLAQTTKAQNLEGPKRISTRGDSRY